MPRLCFSLTALFAAATGAMLNAGPSESTTTLSGNCLLYTYANADHIREAPYPCPKVLTFYQPSDADFRSGKRPSLKVAVPVEGAPGALIEFQSAVAAKGRAGAGELAFQFINGSPAAGKCKIELQTARVDLVCTANRSGIHDGRFAFVFSIGEVQVKPGESTAQAFANSTGPIFDQFETYSKSQPAVTLTGTCRYTQNATNIPCASTMSMVVPAFAHLIQGRRPELVFHPTAKGLPEIAFELGPGGAAATGGHGFAVHSINGDTRVDALAQCSFDLPITTPRNGQIFCTATTETPGGKKTAHVARFDIAASANEIESMRRQLDLAVDAAGNPMINISRDRHAVFGILPGKPLPIGIGNCSGDLDAARLTYCFVKRSDAIHSVRLATAFDDPGPEYRWVDVLVNPNRLDPFVSGAVLELRIDEQDAVQRIRITTRTALRTSDYEALKRKFGTPVKETWTEKLDRATQTRVPMPEATWKTGGLNIHYSAVTAPDIGPGALQFGKLTISTDSLLSAVERRKRTR